MATLYALHPDLPEQEFWFDPQTVDITIGSDANCQVVVNHATIAPKHIRIVMHEGYVWVQDLESGFGTYKHGEAITSVYLETERSYHFTIGEVELIIFLNHKDQTIQQTQPVADNSLRSQLLVGTQQATSPIANATAALANNKNKSQSNKAQELQAAALRRAQIKRKKKSSGGVAFFIFLLAIVVFAAGLYFKHEALGTGQNLLHAIQDPAKHYELVDTQVLSVDPIPVAPKSSTAEADSSTDSMIIQ